MVGNDVVRFAQLVLQLYVIFTKVVTIMVVFDQRSTETQISMPVAKDFFHLATANAVEGRNGRSSK